MHIITDSRSYSEFKTFTDHRLVIMTTKITRYHPNTKKEKMEKRIDYKKLNDKEYQESFNNIVRNKLMETRTPINIQERWNRITVINKEAAVEALGYEEVNKKSGNPTIKKLSTEQLELKMKIEACKDQDKRVQMKKDRNLKLRKIKQTIKREEENEMLKQVEKIEELKDDSRRMYETVRELRNKEPRKPLLIQKNDSKTLTTNKRDHVELITDYFEKLFNDENENCIKEINPTPMENKFTVEEIKVALKSLRNNKAAGIDELKVEQLKYGPDDTLNEIANILNEMAATGIPPTEIKQGILVAHHKPNKKQGPLSNLRPIILLSILRKLLAVCMIRRVGNRIIMNIPKTQAAYQNGRSTTEQVFVLRTMAEKAISSKDYEIQVIMMDMSRAFDTVKRDILILDLFKILEQDELHILKLMIENIEFTVRCGKVFGKTFKTNLGTPQGDCLSPILFIFYLANALKEQRTHMSEHDYNIPIHEHINGNYDTIDEQYADDIGWITNGSLGIINDIKRKIPARLKTRGILINENKNEEFSVTYKGDESLKKIKLLGSLIDTKADIKRRKMLAMDGMKKLNNVWQSRKISLKIKLRLFKVYVESIMLYNGEIGTMKSNMIKDIDSF